MKSIETYKALTYRLLVYGFQPVDLVIILLLFVFLHGVFNSLLLDIVVIGVLLIIAKKGKNRQAGYFVSLALFLITPHRLTLKNMDVPSYSEVKNAAN